MNRAPELALRPAGHTSVMASRQTTEVDDLDYFPTPPWAARAGAELIKRIDPAAQNCWEPACGGGHMAHGLIGYFPGGTFPTDIHQYGGLLLTGEMDFLDPAADELAGEFDWIVTNPPFKDGEAFIRAAWPRARRGVAMLLRSVFLEGGKRHKMLYEDCPLSVFAQFAERVPMVKGRWDPDASSATAYGWFIFAKPDALPQWAPVDGMWRGIGIPPGTKARLTRQDDRSTFCGEHETPLLNEAAA